MKQLSSAVAVMLIGAGIAMAPSLVRAEAGDAQDPTTGEGRYYAPYVPYDEPYYGPYEEPYYAAPYYDGYGYYGGPGYLAPYFYYHEFGRHRGYRRFRHGRGGRFRRGFRHRR